jgi:hypothetical protein
MAKEDVVQAKLAQLQNDQTEAARKALGESYDAGYTDGNSAAGGSGEAPVDTTPFAQADVDAAVEAATAPLRQTIADMNLAQDQKDALEEGIADQLAALQESIRGLTVKPA